MNVLERNHVKVQGSGNVTLVFAHGFGCDQNMWRLLVPQYSARFKTVTFDHVGSGKSDLKSYDPGKYQSLEGYASDVIEIVEAVTDSPVILVGHSVSAMIGMLAGLRSPERFAGHIMVGPSPCYINEGDYIGGFTGKTSTLCWIRWSRTIWVGLETWRQPSWARRSNRNWPKN